MRMSWTMNWDWFWFCTFRHCRGYDQWLINLVITDRITQHHNDNDAFPTL